MTHTLVHRAPDIRISKILHKMNCFSKITWTDRTWIILAGEELDWQILMLHLPAILIVCLLQKIDQILIAI